MVHVEIDHRVTRDALLLKRPDGDRHVVERTEPLAVIAKGVMKAATDMTDDWCGRAGIAGEPSRLDRAADHRSEPVDHRRRPWQLQFRDLPGGQCAVPNSCQVLVGVNEGKLLPAGGARLDDVSGAE